jgi:hypothetical protein
MCVFTILQYKERGLRRCSLQQKEKVKQRIAATGRRGGSDRLDKVVKARVSDLPMKNVPACFISLRNWWWRW